MNNKVSDYPPSYYTLKRSPPKSVGQSNDTVQDGVVPIENSPLSLH